MGEIGETREDGIRLRVRQQEKEEKEKNEADQQRAKGWTLRARNTTLCC